MKYSNIYMIFSNKLFIIKKLLCLLYQKLELIQYNKTLKQLIT